MSCDNVHADRGEADVTVVVPTWNSADVLPDQLAALASQDYTGRYEVIVADNGSTDDTRAIVEGFTARDDRFVYLDAGSRRGAAAARNIGVAAATADRILFCDSDDVVSEHWVGALARGLEEASAVGGWLEMFESVPGDVQGSGRSALAPFGTAHFLISASMGVWRDVLDEVGGFDETWGPGEDIDLSLRLLRRGYEFVSVDEAVVHKRVTVEPGAVWRQHYRYGVQRARAAAAFPEYRGRIGVGATLKKWAWILTRLPMRRRDRNVVGPAAMAVGRIVGSLRYRTFYP